MTTLERITQGLKAEWEYGLPERLETWLEYKERRLNEILEDLTKGGGN